MLKLCNLKNNLGRTGEVFYYSNKKETDFVIFQDKKVREAVKVCWELNTTNQKREIGALQEAIHFFNLKEAWLLTYDQEDEILLDTAKIIIRPVWKWLLEDNPLKR